ncbi:MAG: VWA domain-containing protein [Spirochaetales bacterium]
MLSVQRPVILLLLMFLPFLIYMRHFWPGRGGRLRFGFQVYGARGFSPGLTSYAVLKFLAAVSFWVGVVFLIVALAGPARVHRERVFLDRGMDIVIVLDESPSMAATDFGDNRRYDGARELIGEFVENRQNDAIGLVTFAREAALRVPPTTDHELLLERMNELQIMELGDGTALGDGLALAAMHLENSDAPRQMLILLSDGVNNTGLVEAQPAAEMASNLGIPVYSIGVGSQQEVGIDFTDPNTGRRYQALMERGFDEEELQSIAESTGGSYYNAATERSLAQIFESIDSLETVERRSRISVRLEALHRLYLSIAAILFLFEFLVKTLFLREVL